MRKVIQSIFLTYFFILLKKQYKLKIKFYLVDFGNNFRTEELVTAKEGDLIQTSSQLSCYDFGPHCKWRNGGPNKKTVNI